jgi:uncharacterized surface protein with fasciclin (FAS1) repeats
MKRPIAPWIALVAAIALGAGPSLAKPPQQPTIAEIVVTAANASEPEFTILLAALEAVEDDAGFIEALSGKRRFTVFAPTDAAFVALLGQLEMTAEKLLGDTELVAAVLAYHVTPGERKARSVVGKRRIRMLDKNFVFPVGLSLEDGQERIVDLVPGAVDIDASNGVIHVINGVLLPPTP